MDLEWKLVLPLIGVLVLTLLVTGPGMWSEKWGWRWLSPRREPPPQAPARPPIDPGR